jgi:hypothetical protein
MHSTTCPRGSSSSTSSSNSSSSRLDAYGDGEILLLTGKLALDSMLYQLCAKKNSYITCTSTYEARQTQIDSVWHTITR